MTKEVSIMEENLLDLKHRLYEILRSSKAPKWWSELKKDVELYIEVRKGNILDVYYQGGRMAEIKYNNSTQNITVTAHPKYLGYDNEYKEDKNYYKKNKKKDGKTEYFPIYQDCQEWLLNRKEELKANIRKHYSGEKDGENTSEKFIQGELIIKGRDKYLDSEFAHRFYVGGRNTIRIDMVKIEDERVVFEELKRIGDARLRTTKGDPEIITQMKNYRFFLGKNKDVLTRYYRTLYKIKQYLGLPVPKVDDVEKITVDPEPQLIIAHNYEKMGNKREERIKAIENALLKIDVKPIFIKS